ncbi:hypothetical protein ACFSC3_05325 [Sphingomonas floccifaciens]|uniref:Uncharacterized protein n=1 Tax=Sphingomonas floccifaciens TaxID=1844115 RepID=A0ABW4NAQ0_9SPHN
MFTSMLIALSIATGGLSVPVRSPVDIAGLSLLSTAKPLPAAPAKAGKPTQYCVRSTITGSRIQRLECQTRDQWLAQGFDPLAAK